MMKTAIRLSVVILLLTAGCDAFSSDEYDLAGKWRTDIGGTSIEMVIKTSAHSFIGDVRIVDAWGAFTADLYGTREGTVIAFTISRLEGPDVLGLASFDGAMVGKSLIAGDFEYEGRTNFATLHRVNP